METAPTPSPDAARNALVFGATGFIGRWLVKELLHQGVPTTAAVRDIGRSGSLTDWLTGKDVDTSLLSIIQVDLSRDGIGLDGATLLHISEVYNVAGAYAFGMTAEAARTANVDTSRRVVEFASTLPAVVRLVHLSGYRVGGQDAASVPWPGEKRKDLYSRLGAYEASKVESDAVVQATAQKLGVPLTIANPATVIGDSDTGESHQILGLATTIRDLVRGKLIAVPGDSATFVPVVTVDYLARFMTFLPTVDATAGKSYWILDDDTPTLPEVVKLIANHHNVRAPRLRVPVWLVKRLPAAITRADPETLSFLSTDRYPTEPATALAHNNGLRHPDVRAALKLWTDYLVANDFADSPRPAAEASRPLVGT